MSTPDQIVIRPDLKIGSVAYLPADKLDIAMLLSKGLLHDQLVEDLKVQGYYGDLTKEAFGIALARRPAGAPPPAGFTEAYLVELGIVEPGALSPPKKASTKAAPPPPKAPTEKPPKQVITEIKFGPDMIVHGDYRIQPKKAGNWTFFDVADQSGKLLRLTAFRSVDKARTFLDEMVAASTQTPPADTSGAAPEEQSDGSDVQSEPERSDQSGAPEDR